MLTIVSIWLKAIYFSAMSLVRSGAGFPLGQS